jgi:hypothetical protein
MEIATLQTKTTESALSWMLERGIIARKLTRDPETFGTVHGYILSEKVRDMIGTNLVKMVDKAVSENGLGRVMIRDAFLTSAIGAVLAVGKRRLSEDEMLLCSRIVLSFLPYDKLEAAGIAGRTLRSLGRDRGLLSRVQRVLR